MWSPTKSLVRLFALCVLVLSLAGCGYGLGTDSPSVLAQPSPGTLPTLKVKSVENPTLYPWLSYTIRSELRDEVAARGIARWVDSGRADYEISLKVDTFTFRSWLTNREDQTMLYEAAMTLEAFVYEGNTNVEVWRSGKTHYSQNYENVQERTAAGDLTREMMRRLLTTMRRAF